MSEWKLHLQPPRQGTRHMMEGNKPCQDAALQGENEKLIAAVLTDGMGGYEYSQIAARAVAEAVLRFLLDMDCDHIDPDALKHDLTRVSLRAIEDASAAAGIGMDQMDCTLGFAAVLKDGSGCLVGQLGDGAVCILEADKGEMLLGGGCDFKVTANATKGIQSQNAADYFNISMRPAETIEGIMIMSDGLQSEIYSFVDGVKKRAEWYCNLVSQKEKDVCLEKIDRRWSELSSPDSVNCADDDMSLVVIARRNVKVSLPEDANWLCPCGSRNWLEITRCGRCNKDFFRSYYKLRYDEFGGDKRAFFAYLNANPEEEIRILKKHSKYPLEFEAEIPEQETKPQREKKQKQRDDQPAKSEQKPLTESADCAGRNTAVRDVDLKQERTGEPKPSKAVPDAGKPPSAKMPDGNEKIRAELIRKPKGSFESMSESRPSQKKNLRNWLRGKRIWIALLALAAEALVILAIALMWSHQNLSKNYNEAIDRAFSLSYKVQMLEEERVGIQTEQEALRDQLSAAQEENKDLGEQLSAAQEENAALKEQLRIAQEENVRLNEASTVFLSQMESYLPEGYAWCTLDDGRVYIGNLKDGKPEGIGVLLEKDVLMTGVFRDGEPYGAFFVLHADGRYDRRDFD